MYRVLTIVPAFRQGGACLPQSQFAGFVDLPSLICLPIDSRKAVFVSIRLNKQKKEIRIFKSYTGFLNRNSYLGDIIFGVLAAIGRAFHINGTERSGGFNASLQGAFADKLPKIDICNYPAEGKEEALHPCCGWVSRVIRNVYVKFIKYAGRACRK